MSEQVYSDGKGYEITYSLDAFSLSMKGQVKGFFPANALAREVDSGQSQALKKAGANPADYVSVSAKNVLLRRAAWEACEAFRSRLGEIKAADQARRDALAAELKAKVPGLAELQAAIDESARFASRFAKAMDSEQGDDEGRFAAPKSNLSALRAKYPVAALYLLAEGYLSAANYKKSGAGRRAMALILEGKIVEANEALNNWHND